MDDLDIDRRRHPADMVAHAQRTLFYGTSDQHMVVPCRQTGIRSGRTKRAGGRTRAFAPARALGPNRSFDLHPDGERFILAPAVTTADTVRRDKVVFVFNF